MIPQDILPVLQTFRAAGHEAWLVGGCVRDFLLGRPVHDFDVTTSALPEQTMALFPHTAPTGLAHGTVTVLTGSRGVEVTTYRTEGGYADHRRPESVRFVSTLEADLSRRDFTVNAMAMDETGQVVDPFGGQADLRRGVIRCVGQPEQRFREDALRILRAYRFAAQLGFSIDPDTEAAAVRCAPDCVYLSAERIRDEVEKLLCSPRFQAVNELIRLGILARFGAAEPVPLPEVPPERLLRWTAFCAAVPELDLQALRLDKATVQLCAAARSGAQTESDILDCFAAHGEAAARCAAAVSGQLPEFDRLRQGGRLIPLGRLALTGRDLDWLTGPAVGETLRRLQRHVLRHPADNRRETLLKLARTGQGAESNG